MLTKLPPELLISVFSYLDFKSCNKFKLLSRTTNSVFNDKNARALMLLKYYGKGQVLYKTFEAMDLNLDEHLASILLKNNANLPRFLSQIVVQQVIRTKSFHIT